MSEALPRIAVRQPATFWEKSSDVANLITSGLDVANTGLEVLGEELERAGFGATSGPVAELITTGIGRAKTGISKVKAVVALPDDVATLWKAVRSDGSEAATKQQAVAAASSSLLSNVGTVAGAAGALTLAVNPLAGVVLIASGHALALAGVGVAAWAAVAKSRDLRSGVARVPAPRSGVRSPGAGGGASALAGAAIGAGVAGAAGSRGGGSEAQRLRQQVEALAQDLAKLGSSLSEVQSKRIGPKSSAVAATIGGSSQGTDKRTVAALAAANASIVKSVAALEDAARALRAFRV